MRTRKLTFFLRVWIICQVPVVKDLMSYRHQKTESNIKSVQETHIVSAAQQAKNQTDSETAARSLYPDESFTNSTSKLRAVNKFTRDMSIPKNVYLAESRIPRTKGDAEKLMKELRQAGILSRQGNSVYLTPEPGRYRERSFDAIVNGMPYEFRNVTGHADKIERRFSEAKEKSSSMNVFINIDSDVNLAETHRRIKLVVDRHPEYTGKIVVSFGGDKTYFWETGDFR